MTTTETVTRTGISRDVLSTVLVIVQCVCVCCAHTHAILVHHAVMLLICHTHTNTRTHACTHTHRSPWSNKYDPPLPDGAVPSDRLRRLEVEANQAFDTYREL